MFKCRSTPSGTLPTDEDLFDTIGRGMDRSNMPPWNTFTKQERADLVAWIKHFSPRWQTEKPGTPITIPPEPPSTPESVKRGAELFQSMNCWACHGKGGRGNGPSAASLTDSNDNPITPFDFTSGRRFKCGDTDQAMFRDLVTGLDGTPMASFTKATKSE